ncbi:PAS domain S-box protein [bacterium]|nr:PAS domain S-box protein [bacterium]
MSHEARISELIAQLESLKHDLGELQQHQGSVEGELINQGAELIRQRALTQLILDAVGDGIYGLDTSGNVMFLNPAAERLIGYSAAELVGKDGHALIHHTHKDGAPYQREECPLYRTIKDGCTRHGDDELIWHKDGHWLPIEYTASPVVADAEILGAVFSFRDISQREQLREMLEAENRKLHSLDRLKARFISAIVHDLRNPLTSIKGHAELLDDEREALGIKPAEGLRQIQRLADRMNRMVEDMLDFARLEEGTIEILPVEGDLSELVSEIVAEMTPRARAAEVDIRMELPADPLIVSLDAPRIARVFANLIDNAIKFSPASGTVKVRLTHEARIVRTEVSDLGEGIDAATSASLFLPFYQQEAGKKRGGFGLGLSVCKSIVEAHGGEIGVRSAPGEGSTFWFTLPSDPSEPN